MVERRETTVTGVIDPQLAAYTASQLAGVLAEISTREPMLEIEGRVTEVWSLYARNKVKVTGREIWANFACLEKEICWSEARVERARTRSFVMSPVRNIWNICPDLFVLYDLASQYPLGRVPN